MNINDPENLPLLNAEDQQTNDDLELIQARLKTSFKRFLHSSYLNRTNKLLTPEQLTRVVYREAATDAWLSTVNYLWPTFISTATLVDLITFGTHSSAHYELSAASIFLGYASGQSAWSSHLGSNLPGESNYWA